MLSLGRKGQGSKLHQQYERSKGRSPNHLNSNMQGEGSLPWGQGLVLPVWPVARCLEETTLVTLCSWPITLAPLMWAQLPATLPPPVQQG